MSGSSHYFEIRLSPHPGRERTWKHLTRYLQRYVPVNGTVADVGAGYCGFINNVEAAKKYAIDLHNDIEQFAGPDVAVRIGNASSEVAGLPADSLDLLFASNFVEHLDKQQIAEFLDATRKALRPGGRLMLLQPNFRRCAKQYFDDYTHVSIHSDRSLPDLLRSEGFAIIEVDPGLTPLTMKSKASHLSFLVPLYLRLPWRPFGKQMLVVAELMDT